MGVRSPHSTDDARPAIAENVQRSHYLRDGLIHAGPHVAGQDMAKLRVIGDLLDNGLSQEAAAVNAQVRRCAVGLPDDLRCASEAENVLHGHWYLAEWGC